MTFTPDLDEMAIAYAMLAEEHYISYELGGDATENQLRHMRQQMAILFGDWSAQEAIRQAFETLKIVAFHPEGK